MNFKTSLGFIGFSISPFEADIDMTYKGALIHGEINQTYLLESIGSNVQSLCRNESFVAKWAYIVTWFESPPYNGQRLTALGGKSDYKNTFQLLMTSDGKDLYAMFNFIQLDWPNSVVLKSFISGYMFLDVSPSPLFRYHYNQKLIESTNASNLVGKSNMALPGRWFINFNNNSCGFNL